MVTYIFFLFYVVYIYCSLAPILVRKLCHGSLKFKPSTHIYLQTSTPRLVYIAPGFCCASPAEH